LQSVESERKERWFGLGSDENVVQVSSTRRLELYDKAEDVPISRLTRETVQAFRSSATHTEGRSVFQEWRTFQQRYLYFKDERLYDLTSVWAIGTYLYTVFSHFGYLFFYSKQPRSGKSRAE